MKKEVCIVLFMVVSFIANAQKPFVPDFSHFSTESLHQAFPQQANSFMTAEEQKLVFYMNLLRLEPVVFLNDIVKPYVAFNELNVNSYVRSLYKDLAKSKSVSTLRMEQDLYEMAKSHLQDIGTNGLTGHVGSNGQTFKIRAAPLLNKYELVSENVGLGFNSPLDNLMGLLIDDGVKGLGHRKAILSPQYNGIGVAIGSHKEFVYGCVMDFGFL